MSWPRWSVYIPRIALRVVCGVDAVMLTFISQIVFTRVDLPTLGLPMSDTVAHLTSLSSSLSMGFQLYSLT